MSKTETNANSNDPSVNGVPLRSLEAVENAFSYLDDDYNQGAIDRNLSGNKVVIHFRGARVEHWHKIRDAPTIEVTDIRSSQIRTGKCQVVIDIAEA